MRQCSNVSLDIADKFRNTLPGQGAHFIEASDVVELIFQGLLIEFFNPGICLVKHNQNRATVAKEFDDAEPVVKSLDVVFAPRIPDKEIQRAFGEKELVSCVVYLLSAEVPDIDFEIIGDFSFGAPLFDGYPPGSIDGFLVLLDVEVGVD